MRKILIGTTLCLIFLGVNLTAQNYRVQVATYDEKVATDYFNVQGLSNVIQETDVNGFSRYYMKDRYPTQTEAIQAQEFAISKGFTNAQVIDLVRLKEECSSPCATGKFYDGLVVGMIFFDFDKDFLRSKSKEELDALYQIMMENPQFNVGIVAHTDSKGTPAYNIGLSNRRGTMAKKYLVSRGISAARINTEVKGESAPIAKNATADGKDLPEGRQFNRRVEFILKDNDQIRSDLVEDIRIPDYLKVY